MKKTQFIDFLTTIRKTLVSFIAITVFIALGVAFYGGSLWAVDHTEESFGQTYSEGNARTLWVTYPFGLSDEKISQLKEIDGIDQAEGSNMVYRFFENEDNERQLSAVITITENIDLLMNVEGTLPDSQGQTAVLRSWALEHDVTIGDVIVLEEENAVDYREFQSVKKVAEFEGSDYSELEVSTEDPGYLAQNTLTVTAIVDSPVYLSTNPYAHGICSSNGLYIDAVFFVSEKEMPKDAFNGYTSILLVSDELSEMSSFSDEYKTRSEELSEDVQELFDKWDDELVEDFGGTVENLRNQLDDFSSMTGMVSEDGEILYSVLSEMEEELVTQEHFSAVMETDSNNSFLVADNLLNVLNSLRLELGITFLAIGVLICYSVISRLVADSIIQIGTRKALGFYRREILRLYLGYVASAAVLGGMLGILLGVYGIENAFVGVLADQFTFSFVPLICDPMDILPVFFVVFGIIFAVTLLACRAETSKKTITLLQGGEKDNIRYDFFQKSEIFHKLSKLNQTILLNLIQDKKRVFGMITGIAGASALMVAGLSFYFNFTTAFTKQFEDYYHFNYQICYDASSDQASEEIRKILDDYDLDYAEIYTSCFIMDTPDGKTNAPNVVVPANTAELAQIMNFRTESEESVAYEDGVWMSDYYCYSYDEPLGSVLRLKTLTGKEGELTIDHYYRYHLSTAVVMMNSDIYYDTFHEEAAPNAFFVNMEDVNISDLNNKLKEIDGYIYMFNFYESFFDSFDTEKMVVTAFAVLFILMAVLMELMTIINLLNVYISEKKKELIILMINGYDRKYAKRYIYQDTIVLTFVGILIGLILGNVLGERTLCAVEGTMIRMIHGVSLISLIVSSLATIVLTALVSCQSLRRVDRFQLSDIDSGK